jgi:hypothetical protein
LFGELTSATFLHNNYKQAWQIINETPEVLMQMLKDLGITDDRVFEMRIQEERTYLQGLKKELVDETLQMEYYQRLVNLWASKSVFHIDVCFRRLTSLTDRIWPLPPIYGQAVCQASNTTPMSWRPVVTTPSKIKTNILRQYKVYRCRWM